MKYELMFPDQIRKAIEEHWPVVLSLGVLEYHSEHCCLGTDTLVIVRALEILEKEINIIILPPFHYGAASYAVEPPDRNGTIHIDPDALHPFARQLFTSLLRIGFKNIHAFIHHQSEKFTAGMPTDLAFKFAARQCIFDFLNSTRGEGWWGKDESANYYSEHQKGSDPFSWINIHPFMDEESQRLYPADHAGMQETSLMMAFDPQCVDMTKFVQNRWYTAQASKANLDYGNAAKKLILQYLKATLTGSR